MGNGIQGIYKNAQKLYRSRVCFVNGVKCQVQETATGEFIIRRVQIKNKKDIKPGELTIRETGKVYDTSTKTVMKVKTMLKSNNQHFILMIVN